MPWTPTVWVTADIITATLMNHAEGQYDAVVGAANTDITAFKALLLATDTRSLVATAWDADDRPTALEIRDGVDVVAEIAITYNADGYITELVIVADGTTVTYTLTWDGDKFESQTKAVA